MHGASVPPSQLATQRGSQGLLVRLLRSRMRLVRSELLRRKLNDADDDERLQYRVKEKRVAYQRLSFTDGELGILTEGLEELGRRLPRPPSPAERNLLLRCTVLGQAMQAGRRPHSELVAKLNSERTQRIETVKQDERGGDSQGGARETAQLRVRLREWTVRAAFSGVISYMRYNGGSPASMKKAYRLLDRLIRVHREVIVSQIRHGKPGLWLREGRMVRKGLGIDPNRQAYVTPRLTLWELRIIREGLELRKGEMARASEATGFLGTWRLNPSESVLLLKATILYGARYGGDGRPAAWQVASLLKKM
jgi:hypothetical protein